MNAQNKVKFVYVTKKTITQTSNQGFVENIQDLSVITDGLVGDDGQRALVKKLRAHIRVYTTINQNPYTMVPIIVQTAGTFTDTVDLAEGDISVMLDSAIDDDFGFLLITEPKCATSKNTPEDGGPFGYYIWEMSFDIPKNILALLNKETQTERLQSLILGIAGMQTSTAGVLIMTTHLVVHYKEIRKGITIR